MRSRIIWALAGFAAVSLGWASYLQARFTMLDACYANGDPGSSEIHLSVWLSVLVASSPAWWRRGCGDGLPRSRPRC